MNRNLCLALGAVAVLFLGAGPAFAEEAASGALYTPLAKALAIGIAALGGTIGQGLAASAGLEAMGRNPSAAGALQAPLLIGLAFMESLVILAFVIAFIM